MAQPNGRYVARAVTPDPNDIELWVEIDPSGSVTRTFGCGLHLQPRFHDLISELDGGYWILCDETRTMDLTHDGGVANAKVTGTAVQHVSGTGDLLFHWSPFDHFLITDVDVSARTGSNVNWTHGNALDLDTDGNLLVSFRNLNEITKIDVHTGDVLWRLGGLRNEFTFAGGAKPVPGQHGLCLHGAGEQHLLDNNRDPLQAPAPHWALDATDRLVRRSDSHEAWPR